MNNEEQNMAIEGILKLYTANIASDIRKENEKLKSIISKINNYINNLKPLTEEETGIKEMLKLAYKEDNIKNLETSFKTICHLEDFEIAIWNIKNILENGEKND